MQAFASRRYLKARPAPREGAARDARATHPSSRRLPRRKNRPASRSHGLLAPSPRRYDSQTHLGPRPVAGPPQRRLLADRAGFGAWRPPGSKDQGSTALSTPRREAPMSALPPAVQRLPMRPSLADEMNPPQALHAPQDHRDLAGVDGPPQAVAEAAVHVRGEADRAEGLVLALAGKDELDHLAQPRIGGRAQIGTLLGLGGAGQGLLGQLQRAGGRHPEGFEVALDLLPLGPVAGPLLAMEGLVPGVQLLLLPIKGELAFEARHDFRN